MAKYKKSVNVWNATEQELASLQVGQWVHVNSDDPNTRGIWCGIRKPSGTKVVAWVGNTKGRKDPEGYIRNLINYAKG